VAAPLSVHPPALAAYPEQPAVLARLQGFRAGLYATCTHRADALVDLADALLSAPGPVASLPQLSLEPAHRRGWGSLYAALARGRIDAERLRDLLARHPLAGGQPIYAVDVTTWPRCDAECSPERGLYYHPSRHSAGQPIVAGWAFQWIAQISFDRDSWTAPVDARRLHPLDDTDQTAATQIRALLARLGRLGGGATGGPVPLFVFDAGYDSAQLTLDLFEVPVAVLVRLRADRCFYADPPPRPPGAGGRPRRHGAKLALRRPDHLAHPDRQPHRHRRPVRHRDRAGLERAASQAAPPPRPRLRSAAADRARHHPARPGPAHPRPHPPTQSVVAVVGRPWAARSGAGVAGVHPQVRPGAHHPVRQADPRLDDPAAAPPRPSRPLDLAGAGRLHPATPGPPARLRPATAMGAAPTPAATVTLPDTARVSAAAVRTRLAGEDAETLRALPRPTHRPLLGARDPLPGAQEAHQEAKQEATHNREGRLTGSTRPPRPLTSVNGQLATSQG
jgi:hypothetical protein